MSLYDWLFGLNRQKDALNVLKSDRLKLARMMVLSQHKLEFFNKVRLYLRDENFHQLEKLVKTSTYLDFKEMIWLVDKLNIEAPLKNHIRNLIKQYTECIRQQARWFNTYQTLPERREKIGELELLFKVEFGILFGPVSQDFAQLEKDLNNMLRIKTKPHEDLELLREEKIALDQKILSLSLGAEDFSLLPAEKKDQITEFIGKYRLILRDLDGLIDSNALDQQQVLFAKRIKYEIELQIHQLDPILKDPRINPYSSVLSYAETMQILERLRPCHIVLSKQSLINILESGRLLSKVLTSTDREKYMASFKHQRNAVFISAGGPFTHLPIENPREASLIIFSKSIYNMPMTIYPRDSGGYPETQLSIPLKESRKEIEALVQRRQMADSSMMFRYLFNHIKNRQLRASEKEAIVGIKIPRRDVALFPEIIIEPAINLSLAEVVLIPSQMYYSDEMTKYKRKYGAKLVPVANAIQGYWNYVGLKEKLFD